MAQRFAESFGSLELVLFLAFIVIMLWVFMLGLPMELKFTIGLFLGAFMTAPIAYGGIGVFADGNPFFVIIVAIVGVIVGLGILRLGTGRT